MLRAEPIIICTAALRSSVFKSSNFIFAISSTLERLTLPTFSVLTSELPLDIPAQEI